MAATVDIGAAPSDGSWDIGAAELAPAVGGNAPTGHLAGPLWGALAGPVFSLFFSLTSLIIRLI